MPVYQFKGRQYETGKPVAGERYASGSQSLAVALRQDNIMPISIVEKPSGLSLSLGSGVSIKELALFTRQFSVMLDAGLPLVECLAILGIQQDNKIFGKVLEQIRTDVESGSTLSQAMERHPKIFDELFVNMVSAGEAGGILDVILQRLSFFLEKTVKLKRALISAAAYPSTIISVAIAIVVIIMVWVIPVFATLFESLDTSLPLPTRVVIGATGLLTRFALPLAIGGVIFLLAGRYFYRTSRGRLILDTMTLRVPWLGVVLRKIAISRFARTLSTLLGSGIPILEGLEITAGTAGNVVIRNSILSARQEVEEGSTLAEPLRRRKLFPPMVTQIVAVGEQTGQLDNMLKKLADYYEEEADASIANLMTMLEPLMMIFLGGIVGGIVVSMYFPIFTLIGRLAGGQ